MEVLCAPTVTHVPYIHCSKFEDLSIRLLSLYILQLRAWLIWQSEHGTICVMYCYIRQYACFDKYKYHSVCLSDLLFLNGEHIFESMWYITKCYHQTGYTYWGTGRWQVQHTHCGIQSEHGARNITQTTFAHCEQPSLLSIRLSAVHCKQSRKWQTPLALSDVLICVSLC